MRINSLAIARRCAAIACGLWLGGGAVAQADQASETGSAVVSSSGRAYVQYVAADSGSDITEPLQRAIDRARASYGGTVVLPSGEYTVSDTINLAGSIGRFPKGSVNGIALVGSGTTLTWTGQEDGVVLDIPSPWGCRVDDLEIDGASIPGTIGVRYRAGWDRHTNGGKNNSFVNLTLRRLDVGMQIGDLFSPDLVGSSFYNLAIEDVRIGVRILAANVTGMSFFNPRLNDYREAGFKLQGVSGRRIRRSTDDPPPSPGDAVLTDPDGKREIFEDELPAFLREHLPRNQAGNLVAGGGGNDISIFGFSASSDHADAWAIDTNWSNIRVYTGVVRGRGGFLRRVTGGRNGRFNDLLIDVSAPDAEQRDGMMIDYRGSGPVYLIGCSFDGKTRWAQGATVYALGDLDQLDDAGRLRNLGAIPVRQLTVPVKRKSKIVRVDFPADAIGGDDYRAIVSPGFPSRTFWITDKSANGFVIRFTDPPQTDATVDVMLVFD